MKGLIFTLLVIGFIACKKDKEPPPPYDDALLSLDNLDTLTSNIPQGLYFDLTFTSAATGYACSDGFVAKTTDGGFTWDSIPVPVSVPLKRVQFVDDMNGFMIGTENFHSYFFKTADAGETWTSVPLDATDNIFGMYFTDKNNGFIVGAWYFKKTIDGGQTWTSVPTGIPKIFTDIRFRNAQQGYATTGHGNYYATTDGGNTWDSLHYDRSHYFYEIYFTDHQTLLDTHGDSIIGLNNNYLIKTRPTPVQKMLFIDDDHIIGVGMHYEKVGYFPYGDLFITNTAWKTFKQQTFSTVFAVSVSAIARMSSNKAMMLATGFSGTKALVLHW